MQQTVITNLTVEELEIIIERVLSRVLKTNFVNTNSLNEALEPQSQLTWMDYEFSERARNAILRLLDRYNQQNENLSPGETKSIYKYALPEVANIISKEDLRNLVNCGIKTIAEINKAFNQQDLTLKP